MIYKIKRGNAVIASVEPEGRRSKKIMDVNTVEMSFSMPDPVQFAIGDYVDVFGERYTIEPPNLPDMETVSTNEYKYNLLFKGRAYRLQNASYFQMDGNNEYTEADFTFMGNANTFIDLLIINANRYGGNWVKGTVDDTPYKNMAFSNENCLSVLSTLATTYNLEWWVEGQTIHMTKIGIVENVTLQYGRGKGLYNLSRKTQTDKNIVTRLYAYGSDKNLPTDYKGYAKRLKIPALIGNTKKHGIIEKSVTFDDIKPERLGVVSSVTDEFTFTDASMDFDVNAQLLPGIKAKVQFNTGQLAGYAFEISKYNAATKTFTILTSQDEKALVLPSDLFMPAVGDEYVLIDLNMPQSYIDNAHERLLVKAQEYLDDNSEPMVVYSATPDPFHFKRRKLSITLGNYVRVVDTGMGLNENIRITAYTQNLQNEYEFAVDLQQIISVSQTLHNYENYKQIVSAIKLNRLTDIAKSRMSWLMAEELRRQIYDPDGFFDTDNIKPASIQTGMLSTGVKSQQFALQGVTLDPNFEGTPSKFYSSNGLLIHFTVSSAPVTWVLKGQLITGLVASQPYYIYVKCSKNDNTAQIVLSIPTIGTEQVNGYYHFWVGVVHSVIDGVRGISATYGQTLINGRFINTGRVQGNGVYMDLDTGEIGGKMTFLNGTSGYQNLIDKPNLSALGRNMVSRSKLDSLNGWTINGGTVNVATIDGVDAIYIGATKFADGIYANNKLTLAVQKNTDYVISFDVRGVYYETLGLYVGFDAPVNAVDVPNDNSWHRLNYTINSGNRSGLIALNIFASGVQQFYVKNLKIEKGNVATDYSLAPEDTDFKLAEAQTFVNAALGDLQSQIDGKVEAWFDNHEPTSSNYPANLWLTDAERNRHQGDVFYWNAMGYAYRYTLDSGSYKWVQISDNDIVLALTKASTAQDTADKKRQVFTMQPYTPYDAGDLWTDGSNLYKCVTTRKNGLFDVADWDYATTYDNTVTTINGGVVTTGTINLGNSSGQNAGITGNGQTPESIRFWAGASFDDRATARFRVNDAGKAFMTDAEISGTVVAQSGSIGNFTIDEFGLINTENKDAYIIQRRTYPSGQTVEASIGTNISAEGYLGKFKNYENSGRINWGVLIACVNGTWGPQVSGELTGNLALTVQGDIYQYDGNVLFQGTTVLEGALKIKGAVKVDDNDTLTGAWDLRLGGDGYKKFTFNKGFLISVTG